MKFLEALRDIDFFIEDDIPDMFSCSVVGNSGILSDQEYGEKIDSNEEVIRFNGAITKDYEKHVGSKTKYRIMNCHYILNIDNEQYYNHQKTRFPNMDRYFLYSLQNENIIFKTEPSWKLWQKEQILKKVRENNKVFFISDEMYRFGKKINNGIEPTNGFIGLLLALKYYKKIDCFGFSFYKEQIKKHYYENVACKQQKNNHNFTTEEKWFSLLRNNNIIKMY